MKSLLLGLLAFASFQVSFGQTPQFAVVKPNGTTNVYTSWALAYAGAENDDYIYLPGAIIPGPISIEKRLHLFGSGFFPDSCIATSKSIINGNVSIKGLASNGSMQGLDINGITYIGSTQAGFTNKIHYYTINRCELENIYFDSSPDSLPEYITISENLIKSSINSGSNTPKGANCFIYKNVFIAYITSLNNSTIKNNIFLPQTNSFVFGYINNSVIENNIITNPDSYIFWSAYPSCYNNLINNLKLQDTTFNACNTVI